MELLKTGIDGLDEVLCGGLPKGDCYLIEGAPGTGKTTLGLQYLYQGVEKFSEPGLFLAFEEMPQRLRRDAQSFGWDLKAMEDAGKLRLICIGPEAMTRLLTGERSPLEEWIKEVEVKRCVVDSISHLQTLASTHQEARALLYSLINSFKRLGVSSLLIKESRDELFGPEDFLVDTVIRLLDRHSSEGGCARFIEVIKTRGQKHLPGLHPFQFAPDGIKVLPLSPPSAFQASQLKPSKLKKVSTGVKGLDAMLKGGFIEGFSVMIAGSAGTGKSTFGYQFLLEGIRSREPAALVSFGERPDKIYRVSQTYGLDLIRLLKRGSWTLLYEPPVSFCFEAFLEKIKNLVQTKKIKRLVIDSITDIEELIKGPERFHTLLFLLLDFLTSMKVTTIITAETTAFSDSYGISYGGLSNMVDGILLLRFEELGQEIAKNISILKMKGIDHDKKVRHFSITPDEGIKIHMEKGQIW